MKTIIIYSGGLDSTVLLRTLLDEKEVIGLHFNYGQKHYEQEYYAAKEVFKAYNLRPDDLIPIDLPFINNLFKSALLNAGEAIPNGNYNKEDMSKTIVPFRNGIMLSIAAGYAQSISCHIIAIANHAGDHFVYPDCRPAFIHNMSYAIGQGTEDAVQVISPFVHKTKSEIVKLGAKLQVPFRLSYSCYKGGVFHCGVCSTCLERKQAFKDAEVEDPTHYMHV